MVLNEKALVNILDPEDVKVNILVLNGSPRPDNNSMVPMERAIAAAEAVPGACVDTFHFRGKKLEFCRHCINYCTDKLECMHKDDFAEFRDKWLWADGIIWVAPVYHMGPPSQIRAVLDRLSEVGFHTVRAKQIERGGPLVYAKYTKAVGAIVHGATRYGGQEITLQFFMNHAILLDCFYVTGDMPECYLGAAGHSPTPEAIRGDESFLHSAATVGRRVTEMAKIIKAGLMLATDSIPADFFASKKSVHDFSKEEFKARIAQE